MDFISVGEIKEWPGEDEIEDETLEGILSQHVDIIKIINGIQNTKRVFINLL